MIELESSSDDNTPLGQLKQQKLKVFQGINLPFTQEQTEALQLQACQAVVATNSSFLFWENFKVVKFVYMLRSAAPKLLPSGKVCSGPLLDACVREVEEGLREIFLGREVGLSYVNRFISMSSVLI